MLHLNAKNTWYVVFSSPVYGAFGLQAKISQSLAHILLEMLCNGPSNGPSETATKTYRFRKNNQQKRPDRSMKRQGCLYGYEDEASQDP